MMSSQDKIAAAPFSRLDEAYAWLDAHINYEKRLDRISARDEAFKLDPVRRLLSRLGHPERQGVSVHIAGSRGKGSSAMALEALLRASGLRVATFTSPHIHEYRERIRLDGAPIPPEAFVECLAEVACAYRPERENAQTFQTVFELLTASFFVAARRARADVLIVETGLGGRLDCTNVLEPGGVLLTRIGLEHTHILGKTVEAIAAEKAAILKPGGWGVTTRQESPAATRVFDERAAATGAPLLRAEREIPLRNERYTPKGMNLEFDDAGTSLQLDLPLYGPFLGENLQGVLAFYRELMRRENLTPLSPAGIARELAGLRLRGRMEPLPLHGRPGVRLFVDGAHCPMGARAVARTLEAHFGANAEAIAVVGMMADKDHNGFFEALKTWPHWRRIIGYQLSSMPRAAPAESVAAAAKPHFPEVETCSNLRTALQLALDQADERAMIVALGSMFSVGPVTDWSRCHGRA